MKVRSALVYASARKLSPGRQVGTAENGPAGKQNLRGDTGRHSLAILDRPLTRGTAQHCQELAMQFQDLTTQDGGPNQQRPDFSTSRFLRHRKRR